MEWIRPWRDKKNAPHEVGERAEAGASLVGVLSRYGCGAHAPSRR